MAMLGLRSSKALPPPTLGDIARCLRSYRRTFGRYPNFLTPQRFTEKVQWRRLFDLDPRYALVSDKIAARDFVARRVGAQWLPRLLWTGDSPDNIPFDRLEPPYVLKTNHASAQSVLVTDAADIDRDKVRDTFRSWLGVRYGEIMREPAYTPIRPRLLAEHLMLEADGSPPLEHKFFVFDGKARMIHTVVVDRQRARFDAPHTPDWTRLHWCAVNQVYEGSVPRPEQLDTFIHLAETIAAGFDHLRVDFYEWNKQPVVGELTVYNMSGVVTFKPDDVDVELGSYWTLPHPLRRALPSLLRGLPVTARKGVQRLRARANSRGG